MKWDKNNQFTVKTIFGHKMYFGYNRSVFKTFYLYYSFGVDGRERYIDLKSKNMPEAKTEATDAVRKILLKQSKVFQNLANKL